VALVADTHLPHDIHAAARAEFSDQELVELTMAVLTINGWNRLLVSFCISPAVAGGGPARCTLRDARNRELRHRELKRATVLG
jgi:hypothetical protein